MTTSPATEPEPVPWYDRISDRFNAILIKESRQSLKSRQFVATFMLLLAISWVVSVFLLLNSGIAIEFGAMGDDFFYWFYLVLAFASFVIVPFVAFRSLVNERDFSTFDLLSITVLKPRQIVWGKLLSAGLQLFLIFSAVTPFIAFASLLQGFNTVVAAVLLVSTMLLSMLLSMWSLMLATFAKSRAMQALITAGLFMGLMITFISSYGSIFTIAMIGAFSVSSPYFWYGAAFAVVAGGSYFVLFQQIAVSQLTFDSDNRSTGIRIVCTGQFWLLWIIFAIFHIALELTPSEAVIGMCGIFSAIHWALSGLFFCTESDALSRRVRRGIPIRKPLRAMALAFLPGGSRGYLLALGHLLALWGIVVIMYSLDGMRPAAMTVGDYYRDLFDLQSAVWNQPLRLITAACLYVAIFLGIGTIIGRWGMAISSDVKPSHARIFTVLVVACGLIFPLMLRVSEAIKGFSFTVFDITNPFKTMSMLTRKVPAATVVFDWSSPQESLDALIAKRGLGEVVIVILAITAVVVFLVNGLALWRGMTALKPLTKPKRLEDLPPENGDRSV